MMRTHPVADRGDLHADHLDLAAARSWMSKVCGPHRLEAASPGLVQFQHHGNVLKSMCTTLGYIGYGTDVTITVEDAAAFNAYSLSLPLSGEQELCRGGLRLLSDVRRAGDHRAQRAPGAEHRRGLPQAAGGDRPHGDAQGPGGDVAAADRYALRFDPEMDALDGASASWWRTVRHISEEMARSELYAQAFFSSDLERALIKGLILAQPNTTARPCSRPWRAPAALPAARPRVSPGQRPRDPEPGGRGTRRRGLAVQAVRGLPSLLRGVADELPEALPARRGARGISPAAAPAASRRSPWAGASATSDASPWTTASASRKPRA